MDIETACNCLSQNDGFILAVSFIFVFSLFTLLFSVALGSDFNPNAYCLSMPIVMYLACTQMRLSMAEALVASTINAAYSINRGKTHGALSCGRFADIVVLGRHFISFLS